MDESDKPLSVSGKPHVNYDIEYLGLGDPGVPRVPSFQSQLFI